MTPKWRDEQRLRLRGRLYDASIKLFKKKGYDKTTVQRITDEAQVGKGTFFNHFPSKEHVVVAWYNSIALELLERLQGQAFPSAEAALLALTQGLARLAEEDADLYDIKARIRTSDTLLTEAEQKTNARIRAFCRQQVEKGKTAGELDSGLDSRFFVDTVSALFTGTSREWLASAQAFDLCRTVEKRLAFLFRAARC